MGSLGLRSIFLFSKCPSVLLKGLVGSDDNRSEAKKIKRDVRDLIEWVSMWSHWKLIKIFSRTFQEPPCHHARFFWGQFSCHLIRLDLLEEPVNISRTKKSSVTLGSWMVFEIRRSNSFHEMYIFLRTAPVWPPLHFIGFVWPSEPFSWGLFATEVDIGGFLTGDCRWPRKWPDLKNFSNLAAKFSFSKSGLKTLDRTIPFEWLIGFQSNYFRSIRPLSTRYKSSNILLRS